MKIITSTIRTTQENFDFLKENSLDLTWFITALLDECRGNPKLVEKIKPKATQLKREHKKVDRKVELDGKKYTKQELLNLLQQAKV